MSALPLAGLRVAVTRPAAGAAELEELLLAAGAVPLVLPLIRILPVSDSTRLREALHPAQPWDWAVFTSANAIRALTGLASDPGAAWRRSAVVGPTTAAVLAELLGRRADVRAADGSGDGIVAAMPDVRGARVFWPRAEHARMALRGQMEDAGAIVHDVVAYSTVEDAAGAAELHRRLAAGDVDVVTLTSPSAVRSLVSAGPVPAGVRVAVIGATTAAAARAAGLSVDAQASNPDLALLVESLGQMSRG